MTDKKRKTKSLPEQLRETQEKLKKIQDNIEKQKRKTTLNFFIDIAEDEEILNFMQENSKNKEIQKAIHAIIKEKIQEFLITESTEKTIDDTENITEEEENEQQ